MLLLALSAIGCGWFQRSVTVQKQMTWACAADRVTPDYPEAQPVRLNFVEKPAYEIVEFGKGLCDRLSTSARRVVTVDFEAWGNSYEGLRGFRTIAIDGEAIINVGGYGTSGVTGNPGRHPLEYFKNP